MITAASSEWVLLSAAYHHVLALSASPEQARINLTEAWRSGPLQLSADEHEHVAGEQTSENRVKIEHRKEVPKEALFDCWDWERSHAITINNPVTGSVFEYVNIAVHRDKLLELWPAVAVEAAGAGAKRGAKEKFDWEAIQVEIIRHLIDDGIPDNVTELANKIVSWCQNQFGEENTPDLQTMRKKIKIRIAAYRRWLPPDH